MNIYDFLKTGALEDLKLGINEKDIKFPASIIPYRGDVDEYVHYLIGDPVEVCVIEGITKSHQSTALWRRKAIYKIPR